MKRISALLARVVTAAMVVAGGLVAIAAAPASADTTWGSNTDQVASATGLPTVQIDGVVWAQVVIGNTVYVGGEFTTVRPAGSALGANTTPRSNLLAYDITTGNLITSWAPTTNGPVYALNVSPDQKTVYVGGNFNLVNGSARGRFAALDATTGAADARYPIQMDGSVRTITSTANRVYIGGDFSMVNNQTRNKLAAFEVSTGALSTWTGYANLIVTAMAVSPDGTQVYVGGNFNSVNGVVRQGTAALDASTAALTSWSAYPTIYNSGANSGITSLTTDGNLVYATAFTYLGSGTSVGNDEGAFALDPTTGAVVWQDDCHGDTYSLFANPGYDHVYVAGHPHMCNNIGAYPEGATRYWRFGTAYTKAAKSVVTPNTQSSYWNNAGLAAPEQLNFYPIFAPGTYTGLGQATWSVTGNSNYVAYGGEFTAVNGVGQQGLVRFAKYANAPSTQGPQLSGSSITPKVVAKARGTLDISWPANWDPDNGTLTYTVLRNGVAVHTMSAYSRWWALPRVSWVDTGLSDGTSYSYTVQVSDSQGNVVTSPATSATTLAASATALAPYASTVLNDDPGNYWRMGETSGVFSDWTGYEDLTAYAVTRGATGAITGDADKAATFTGVQTSRAVTTNKDFALNNLSVEAWFKTTSTTGGKIIGFGGGTSTQDSPVFDRNVYMTAAGQLVWGTYPGGIRTVASTLAYNDGSWHHVVGTVGPKGLQLYVDAVLVGADPTVISGQYSNIANYVWHIGGDSVSGWPNAASGYFNGSIDEAATYGYQLSQTQVSNHYSVGSGKTPNQPPVAALAVSAGTLTASADATGSYDPDGSIASYQFSWGDGQTSTSTTPTATHAYAVGGTYTVSVTVVDNQGAQSTAKQTVLVHQPPVATVSVTSVNGLEVRVSGAASTDTDGTINAYQWAWDDGTTTTTTGPTTKHLYAGGGAHGVTLTVSDTHGSTSTASTSFTLSAGTPDGTIAFDTFSRTTLSGWGTADMGGAWTTTGTTSATGTAGQLTAAAGSTATATLPAVAGSSLTTSADLSLGTISTGSNTYLHLRGRITPNGDYQAIAGYSPSGKMSVWLVRTNASGVASTIASAVQPTGATYGLGAVAHIKLQVTGTAPTTVQAKLWFGSQSEPAAWTVSTTDATALLQTAGTTGLTFEVPSAVTSGPLALTVDNYDVVSTTQVDQPPTAAFATNATGLSLAADASASADPDGTIVSYAWTWGDGTTSTTTTPTTTHVYTAGGNYTVGLTVTDDDGATATASQSVTVVSLPVAAFTATQSNLTTAVDASATTAIGGSIVSYAWAWGDGTTSTTTTPTTTHTYAAPGAYPVTLTATNNLGATATASKTVTAVGPPNAVFTATANGLVVSANAAASTTPNGSFASYLWTWGDGTTSTTTTPTTTHTYASGSVYTVGLTVTDAAGGTSSASQTLSAYQAPVAAFTAAAANLVTSVDATASSTVNGTIAGYAWTWGDGTTSTTTTPTTTHTYATAGQYTITLTVTDGAAQTATATRIVAAVSAPTAAFSASASGLTANVNATASSTPNGAITGYAWTWGDGTTSTTTTPTTSHAYTAGGTYTIRLQVTDSASATATASQTVTVLGAPTASFTVAATSLTATANGAASTSPNGAITSYAWSWGDGTTSTTTTSTATHAYTAAGTYTVGLTVTDAASVTGTSTQTVTVTAPAGTVASDSFTRTVASGWGTADLGGAWTTTGTTAVNGSAGTMTAASGGTATAVLAGVTGTATTTTADVTLGSMPTGDATRVHLRGRVVPGKGEYRLIVNFRASGKVGIWLARMNASGVGTTIASGVDPANNTFVAGTVVHTKMQVSGTSPTTVQAKVWFGSQAEPSTWTISTTDSTAALQVAGSTGVLLEVPSTVTNGPITATVDNYAVVSGAANQAPTASFTATGGTLSAAVNGSASVDPDGTIASYTWAWGDGTTSTTTTPTSTHTYTTAGTYTVGLTVTDNLGATGTTTTTVVVAANKPPTASFTSSVAGLVASVNGSASVDPDGTVASYTWTWGDGTASSTTTTPTTTHTYAAAGTYPITLVTTDNLGATSTAATGSVTVAPVNQPPTASFTSSVAGLVASVNGSASVDPDGTVASYTWTWGDGTASSTTTTPTTTHTYAAAGTYPITLVATDNLGATSTAATGSVTVAPVNQPPVAAVSVTTTNSVVAADASASTDPDGTVVSYSWNWGDGTASTTTTTPTSTHAYTTVGSYTVTVTVTDNGGATATASGTATVSNTFPANALAGDTFTRTAASGWGNAELGGAWTLTSGYGSVDGSNGVLSVSAASTTANAKTAAVASTSAVTTATFALDAVPNNSGAQVIVRGRVTTLGEYRLRINTKANGSMVAWLTRATYASSTENTLATAVAVPGTYAAGTKISAKISVTGTSPTTVSAKVWLASGTEPTTWLLTATDSGAGLQTAGSSGVSLQTLDSTNLPVVVRFDNYLVTTP